MCLFCLFVFVVMVKLTSDLILRSAFYTNPLHERELDLRALRIPEIENLGATRDAFDCIDFSANDISVLGNFPLLPRLSTLLMSGNRITTIASDTLPTSIPNLQSLQLSNNRVCLQVLVLSSLSSVFFTCFLTVVQISDFAEISHLSGLLKLEHLWLAGNPIAIMKDYRLRVIRLLPSLRFLDGTRITKAERDASRSLADI